MTATEDDQSTMESTVLAKITDAVGIHNISNQMKRHTTHEKGHSIITGSTG
jgi:hypothetical protein